MCRRGDAEGRRAARAGVGDDGDSPHAIRRDGGARCIAHLVGVGVRLRLRLRLRLRRRLRFRG